MPDRLRARSVTETIRPFRWRIAFTYALTVIEDLLELSYPWATGLAINGLLAQDYRMIAPVMIAWVLHTATGCARQIDGAGPATEELESCHSADTPRR